MRWRTGTVGLAVAVVALGANGCVGERDFPKPTQMCEEMVTACGAQVLQEYDDFFRRCYSVGLAGQKDKTHEAQCFVDYDQCVNECEFYGYYLTQEAGADAGDAASALDAGSGLDSATHLLDAQVESDE